MARPVIEGLEYISIDVDIFDDVKLLFVAERFEEKGELIAIKLLLWIYKHGYYINWNDEISLLFAKKNFKNVSSSLVNDVVKELVKRDFFAEDMYNRFSILTSKGIQKRWLKTTIYVPVEFINYEYNLIKGSHIPFFKLKLYKRLSEYDAKKWGQIRKFIFLRDNYTCSYCGKRGGHLEIDHIIPFSIQGDDSFENLTTSCRRCNRQKKNKSAEEFTKWKGGGHVS